MEDSKLTKYIIAMRFRGEEHPVVLRDLTAQESADILIDYALPSIDPETITTRLYMESNDIPQEADFESDIYKNYELDILDHLDRCVDFGVSYKISKEGNWIMEEVESLFDAHEVLMLKKSRVYPEYFYATLTYRIKPDWRMLS